MEWRRLSLVCPSNTLAVGSVALAREYPVSSVSIGVHLWKNMLLPKHYSHQDPSCSTTSPDAISEPTDPIELPHPTCESNTSTMSAIIN